MRKIIIGILLFATTAAVAQPDSTSLVARYRAMALDYNDDLKAAQKHIAASIDLTKAARADRGPKLAAGADASYTGNPIELSLSLPGIATPMSIQGTETKYGFSATLLQPIYTGGRILESIRMAQSEQVVAESQAEVVRSLVCFQTDIQYWNTVARAEVTSVARAFRNSISALSRIIRERVEAGLSDPQELLTVEVKLNEAEYALLQAESQQQVGLMALNSLIGLPLDARTEIDATIAPVGAATVEQFTTATMRPEQRIAEEQIRLETSAMRLHDAHYKPQLHLGANGGYYSPGYDFRPDLSPNYTVYAQVSIPIFEWGKRRNEKRASRQRIGMAQDNLHQVESQIELEARTAWVTLAQAVQRVELAESSLGIARENERRATEKYEEGAISVSEVIDAQVYRQTAQMNDVEARAAAQLHQAELLRAVNGYNCR